MTADKTVAWDDVVTIDLSPQRGGIWGDYARTIIIEDGKTVKSADEIRNEEWKDGLRVEKRLHAELLAFATPHRTFEELHFHFNGRIEESGFINCDFLGNLGHSIETDKAARIYVERGNKRELGSVRCFTFEPHIGVKGSPYGYKRENIYYFKDGKLTEL